MTDNFITTDTGQVESPSVLVVEDEQGIRETLQCALELEGYRTFTAANGREGIDVLAQMPKPGVIFLDLMMPIMDGWGFLEALRRDPGTADIPVVVITAFSDKARQIDVKEILKKPLDLDLLYAAARKWCAPRSERIVSHAG